MKTLLVIPIILFPFIAYSASWESLPNSSLSGSGVVYDWTTDPTNTQGKQYPGDGSYTSIMSAWNGAALDTTRNRMLFWGGGHSAYAGNEMYAFDFDTNTWSLVAEPDSYSTVQDDSDPDCYVLAYETEGSCTTANLDWNVDLSACYDSTYTGNKTGCETAHSGDGGEYRCYYNTLVSTGNPKTIHSYDGVDYYPQIDSFCSNFGSMGATGCVAYEGSQFRCYDFTTDAWITEANGGTFTESEAGGTDMYGAIDPISKLWYGSGNSSGKRFTKYDAATDTRTYGDDHFGTFLNNNYNKNFAVDYRRKRGVLISQLSADIYYTEYEPFVSGSTRLGEDKYTLSGDSSWFDGGTARETGLDYDPVLDKMVFWDDDNQNVYTMDASTGEMSAVSVTGGPSTDTYNGVFSRFKYIPAINKFALVQEATSDVYLLTFSTLTDITTVTLNSTSGDTDYPLTIGQGFAEGDVPNAQEVAFRMPDGYILPTSYECKKTWNDGSCKHAIMSAIVPNLEASTDLELGITTSPDLTEGRDDLAESDIVAYDTANDSTFKATVSFSGQSWTTVDLDNLLGSPDRVFLAGPDVAEAHYHQDVAENSDFVVKFYVRYYSTGDIWIRVGIESGVLDGTNSDTSTTYTPTITIGSTAVFNSSVEHHSNTRYVVDGWINNSHTDTSIKEDPTYLMSTGLVPNYWKTGASDTKLNSLNLEYTPLEQGSWRTDMSATAYHPQIGLLPNWDALYFSSEGDSRAYNAVIANAKALNTYGIVYRDPSTDMPIVIETGTSWDNWTVNGYSGDGGDGGDGETKITRNGLTWEINHHGPGGYLAYLLTGDYYHLETIQYQSTLIYLVNRPVYGEGTLRLYNGEVRGLAWCFRTIGQLVSISPTEAISTDLKSLIDYWTTYFNNNNIGLNGIGYWYDWHSGGTYDGQASTFMGHFLIAAMGYLHDLEPFSDLTDLTAIRDFGYKGVVGILGGEGPDNFCFTYAADPYLYVRDAGTGPTNVDLMYDSWGDCWQETHGSPNGSCGTELTNYGSMASSPSNEEGYWANLLPAIAYAVEDGATGASDSWDRLTGATNWSDVETAGYDDTPVWGIYPRTIEAAPPAAAVTSSGISGSGFTL